MPATGSLIEPVRRSTGDSSVPLVLFLPGLSGNNKQWSSVLELLRDAPADFAYGSPMLAHAAFNGSQPSVTELAKKTAAELSAYPGRSHVIVSHSVGSFVALAIAREAPDAVAALILVNGGLVSVAKFIDKPWREITTHPVACLSFLRLFALVGAPVPAAVKRLVASRQWATRLVVGGLVSDMAVNSQAKRDVLVDEAGNSETLLSLWKNRHHWPEFKQYASEIKAETVIVDGANDPVTRGDDAQQMAALLPNARVQVLPDVGHAAPVEASDAVADAIKLALNR